MRFLILILTICSVLANSSAADADVFPVLPAARVEALWQNPAKASIEELYSACLTTGKAKDWERAAFFLWCAQVRLQFERAIFSPKKKGGNSPTLPWFAIGQMAGQSFVPRLYARPEAHKKVLDRLRAYVPDFEWGYRPSWSYDRGIPKAEAQAQAQKAVSAIVDASARILELTANPEYLESLQVYANDSDESVGRPERFRAANQTMWRIEEEKKIKSGLAFKPSMGVLYLD